MRGHNYFIERESWGLKFQGGPPPPSTWIAKEKKTRWPMGFGIEIKH